MAKRSWYKPEPTIMRAPQLDPATRAPAKISSRRAARGRTPSGCANPIDIHVGARTRMRRTLLGLTQGQLGDALGLSFQQVLKYEKGANRIGASRLFDLSRILGVPVGWFFDEMPDSVAAAGPSAMRAATEDPQLFETEEDMKLRETLELVRALERIPADARDGLEAIIHNLATAE